MADKNFWDSWDKKPWTKEQCARRYIEGDRISLRQLATDSEVALRTLCTWSSKGNWTEKRQQFGSKLAAVTQEKLIEKTSDRLSDTMAGLAEEHLKAHQQFRKLVQLRTNVAISQINQADDRLAAIEAIDPVQFNLFSLILDRAIKGERAATGLEYQIDINSAAAVLENAGYVIIDPSQTEEIKLE